MLGAALVMGIFFGLFRLSTLGPDYKGRLARFVGNEPEKPADDKKPKLAFNLGLGESQMAVKVEKAMGKGGFGLKVQRKLAQADLKLTLLEFMLTKVFTLCIGIMAGLYLGRGGPVQQVIFGVSGIVIGYFAPDW